MKTMIRMAVCWKHKGVRSNSEEDTSDKENEDVMASEVDACSEEEEEKIGQLQTAGRMQNAVTLGLAQVKFISKLTLTF